jgi:hypothetical protein
MVAELRLRMQDGRNEKSIFKNQKLELIDKLRFNLANQHRYILNDVTIWICLTRPSNSFALYSTTKDDEGTIKILSALYYIRKQLPFPSIILAHQRLLEKGEIAQYLLKNTEVKYFTIS